MFNCFKKAFHFSETKVSIENNQKTQDIPTINHNGSLFDNFALNVRTRIHDIKTPLNNIILAVSNDSNISNETKLTISENTHIIKHLLNDILKNKDQLFSFKYNPQRINISRLLKKLKYLIKYDLIHFGNTLKIINDLDFNYFYVDEELITRLIVNLIKNSMKHSSQSNNIKDIILRLYSNKIINNGDCVCEINLVVSDFNKEIDLDIQDKLFLPKDKHSNGDGLGLYICNQISKLHNGHITYKRDAEVNNFILTIRQPFIHNFYYDNNDSDDDDSYNDQNIKNKIHKLVSNSQFDIDDSKFDLKVLIIDDCITTLKLMKMAILRTKNISQFNITIDTMNDLHNVVNNNDNILNMLLSYNIIITDFDLGKYTCNDFIPMLCNNNYKGKIYCITGNEENEHNLNSKIDGVFFKPINIEIFNKIIVQH
jgi:hypothetical protein